MCGDKEEAEALPYVIARHLPASHKCVYFRPAGRALVNLLPVNGCRHCEAFIAEAIQIFKLLYEFII